MPNHKLPKDVLSWKDPFGSSVSYDVANYINDAEDWRPSIVRTSPALTYLPAASFPINNEHSLKLLNDIQT
jgi:hypothetical protein